MSSLLLVCLLAYSYLIECKLIPDSTLDLTEVAYHNEPSEIYLGSPSIVRLSSGRLLGSHDFFGAGCKSNPANVSVYSSDDNGQSWSFLSYIKHSYWTTLTVYKNMIYAIGIDNDANGNLIIHRSDDNGATWMYNGNDDGIVLFYEKFATGATPIVIGNQVMYRAVEYWNAPSRWPTDFQAAIISCDLSTVFTGREGDDDDDPIMSPKNWRITPPVSFNTSWLPKSYPPLPEPGFLGGNVVILRKPLSSNDIRILNVLRFNSLPLSNLTITLELNQTTNAMTFLSIIRFPGGMTKFTIRYDPVSEAYFAFVNPVISSLDPYQRNVLSLS